jgi:hypothetical protein
MDGEFDGAIAASTPGADLENALVGCSERPYSKAEFWGEEREEREGWWCLEGLGKFGGGSDGRPSKFGEGGEVSLVPRIWYIYDGPGAWRSWVIGKLDSHASFELVDIQ